MAQQQTASVTNGVELETLLDTIHAMERDAELGTTRFRATNRWINGTHNRSATQDFHGLGEEKTHQERFESDADEPSMLGGHDQAPNPAEHLLNALAACVTTSMVAHAAARGIRIEELESELEGDLDLRGFLGVSHDVPRGYTNIRVKFRVKADVDNMERLRRLTEYSPVYNTLLHGANVEIDVEPM